jgi:hypothetical protein
MAEIEGFTDIIMGPEAHNAGILMGHKPPSIRWRTIPDYTQSLDAVHRVWLRLTPSQHRRQRDLLQDIVQRDGHRYGPCVSVSNAEAVQRCEAIVQMMMEGVK